MSKLAATVIKSPRKSPRKLAVPPSPPSPTPAPDLGAAQRVAHAPVPVSSAGDEEDAFASFSRSSGDLGTAQRDRDVLLPPSTGAISDDGLDTLRRTSHSLAHAPMDTPGRTRVPAASALSTKKPTEREASLLLRSQLRNKHHDTRDDDSSAARSNDKTSPTPAKRSSFATSSAVQAIRSRLAEAARAGRPSTQPQDRRAGALVHEEAVVPRTAADAAQVHAGEERSAGAAPVAEPRTSASHKNVRRASHVKARRLSDMRTERNESSAEASKRRSNAARLSDVQAQIAQQTTVAAPPPPETGPPAARTSGRPASSRASAARLSDVEPRVSIRSTSTEVMQLPETASAADPAGEASTKRLSNAAARTLSVDAPERLPEDPVEPLEQPTPTEQPKPPTPVEQPKPSDRLASQLPGDASSAPSADAPRVVPPSRTSPARPMTPARALPSKLPVPSKTPSRSPSRIDTHMSPFRSSATESKAPTGKVAMPSFLRENSRPKSQLPSPSRTPAARSPGRLRDEMLSPFRAAVPSDAEVPASPTRAQRAPSKLPSPVRPAATSKHVRSPTARAAPSPVAPRPASVADTRAANDLGARIKGLFHGLSRAVSPTEARPATVMATSVPPSSDVVSSPLVDEVLDRSFDSDLLDHMPGSFGSTPRRSAATRPIGAAPSTTRPGTSQGNVRASPSAARVVPRPGTSLAMSQPTTSARPPASGTSRLAASQSAATRPLAASQSAATRPLPTTRQPTSAARPLAASTSSAATSHNDTPKRKAPPVLPRAAPAATRPLTTARAAVSKPAAPARVSSASRLHTFDADGKRRKLSQRPLNESTNYERVATEDALKTKLTSGTPMRVSATPARPATALRAPYSTRAPASSVARSSTVNTQNVFQQASAVDDTDDADLSLPEARSEYSNSDDEECVLRRQKDPSWTRGEELDAALHRQMYVDPDEIFGVPQAIEIESMLPTRNERRRTRPRSSSANWSGPDGLAQWEIDSYNRRMGIRSARHAV